MSPSNNWITPNGFLRFFGKNSIKDMGFDVDKPKSGAKSKNPKERIKQIELYVEEMDDNAKQFARELNTFPTSEDNQDNSIL